MTEMKNVPDAWRGIEDKSTETPTKETTTFNNLLESNDNSPAAEVECDVPGCPADAATHDPRDTPDGWVHCLPRLHGHDFDLQDRARRLGRMGQRRHQHGPDERGRVPHPRRCARGRSREARHPECQGDTAVHGRGVVVAFSLRPPFRVQEIVVAATTMNFPAVPAVSREVEGEQGHLSPDNARALATALIDHADRAEHTAAASR